MQKTPTTVNSSPLSNHSLCKPVISSKRLFITWHNHESDREPHESPLLIQRKNLKESRLSYANYPTLSRRRHRQPTPIRQHSCLCHTAHRIAIQRLGYLLICSLLFTTCFILNCSKRHHHNYSHTYNCIFRPYFPFH